MVRYALCPFFENVKEGVLRCEGTRICFPEKKDRVLWLNMHCCSQNYKICRFYTALMKKYDEIDTNGKLC